MLFSGHLGISMLWIDSTKDRVSSIASFWGKFIHAQGMNFDL